jgi:hypothetical protein
VADLIDREKWVTVGVDVKGDAYEGLLEKNAQDTKSGAGQYFTPRPLIDAIVECIRPQPGENIIDPACGTGGFLLAAHAFLTDPKNNPNLTKEDREHLRLDALRGVEIVQSVTRLCAMNLMLHGVGPTPQELDVLHAKLVKKGMKRGEADADIEKRLPIRTDDALRELGSDRYHIVLTNPPFGKKSSIMVVTDEGETDRRMKPGDLEEFVKCFNPKHRGKRKPTFSEESPSGRWRAYDYEELVARDKCSLDLFWLKDEGLLDADDLPEPDVIALEIAEDLRSAVAQIEEILGDLQGTAE